MIKMKSGASLIGNTTKTPSSGAFEAGESVENRLVSLGVAEFVNTGIATPVFDDETPEAGENKTKAENAAENDLEGTDGTPVYGVESSVSYLRKIAKENGITFKVGMTKEEMVKALDGLFNDAPNLGVEDPIE